MQRIETIGNKRYISALRPLWKQIAFSEWHRRGWTMQEGQLSRRIAFFGDCDIVFACTAGAWRESLHSGRYGHDLAMPGIDQRSRGHNVLSVQKWMSSSEWKFEEYNSILMSYTPRGLTFESDKLNAIAGCLNLISLRKDLQFFRGLPSYDFQYALLWTGEYDRPITGFPSWSWAGWHCLQQSHWIYPLKGSSNSFARADRNELLQSNIADPPEIEAGGLLVQQIERPNMSNRCSQTLAGIEILEHSSSLRITSECAHFAVEIHDTDTVDRSGPCVDMFLHVPTGFNSTRDPMPEWGQDKGYWTPYERMRLRDSSGNEIVYHYPRWYDHWPPVKFNFPNGLRGSTFTWLLRDGIELVKIVEVKLIEGAENLKHFHHVLCIGIHRNGESSGSLRRMGTFVLPREVWDRAGPKETTVEVA
jgi:hypothetical protein